MLKFLRIMRLMRTFFLVGGGWGQKRAGNSHIDDATVDVTSYVSTKGLRPQEDGVGQELEGQLRLV